MKATQPIGIFDSGVGGLTIAKEIKRVLPKENLIYFGDTQHLPYGDKSPETIREYAQEITQFLLDKEVKAIVIACNTASANALKEVQEMAQDRALVFDVISPVAEKVAYQLHQKVGVIATKATVNSKLYSKSIRKHNKYLKVQELATPLLVPIIEEGLVNSNTSKEAIQHYLTHKKLQDIDTLILGCTHYPLMEKEVGQFYGKSVEVVNSPRIVANHIQHQLDVHQILNQGDSAMHKIYVSDYTPEFAKQAKKFFGKKVDLESITL